MNITYKKSIIDLIRKNADELDDLDEPTAPAVPVQKKRIAPVAKPASELDDTLDDAETESKPVAPRPVVSSIPVIKEMQTALVNLAKVVSDQVNMAGTKAAPVGRTSFHDFITQNYLRKSPVKGTEFGADREATKMSSIMGTMSRLGSPENDFAIDGNWGPKTNASLHNAFAFAYAMLKLATDFNLHIKSYHMSMLNKFDVPETDKDISILEKGIKAKSFIQHITAITKMYNEIKEGILNNPAHKEYIEGKPILSYKKIERDAPEETAFKQLLSKTRLPINNILLAIPMPGRESYLLNATINYADLVDLENFNKWYDSSTADQFRKYEITKTTILAYIRKTVKDKIPPASEVVAAQPAAQTAAPTWGAK